MYINESLQLFKMKTSTKKQPMSSPFQTIGVQNPCLTHYVGPRKMRLNPAQMKRRG